MNGFPWHDWQFYVSSLLVLAAVVWLVRAMLPRSWRRGKAPRTRVKLTISAQGGEGVPTSTPKKPGGGKACH
ncbi:MAG TPA: hypothetical protein PL072_01995 [Phycisphaerales bacterium]|nr:hypothetical protein [Phycisphaerales bacterium]